jgi:uncharacterized protein (UPF0276 family)
MSFLGFGAGLRAPHYSDVLSGRVLEVDWFEAISENYLGYGEEPAGRPLETLLKVRQNFPIVLHGVSLSIGGTDPFDRGYLKSLRKLYEIVDPAWVSDHLCWTGVHGHNLHDLLPLPYTRDTIGHVVSRIQEAQDILGRRLTIENVSSYLSYASSEMSEWEFLSEIHARTGCGLLLDVNNVFVSAHNHAFNASEYLQGIPQGSVTQMHLAGHSSNEALLIDTHDAPVCDGVWQLYAEALKRFGRISTLIEWDGNIPGFERLEEEVSHARSIAQRVHGSPILAQNPNRSSKDFHRPSGAQVSVGAT